MPRKRVLIVDDDQEIRFLIRTTLEFSDYDIHEAKNGPDAMRLVKMLKPNVIILDILMPGDFDGFEVCRRIKLNQLLANTRVILLSAMSDKEYFIKGGVAGADAYLVKPFSPVSLIDTLKT